MLRLHSDSIGELRRRGVVRTANSPLGDYAEYLVAHALEGELAPNSEPSWDVNLSDGQRLQVKARVISNPERIGQRQLSPIRSWDFDQLVVVLLHDDFTVMRAMMLPRAVAETQGRYQEHVRGRIIFARGHFLALPELVDITNALAAAQARI